MKALSLWQPWATLMAIGAKRIETRSWNMRYRGPLAICATKTWNRGVLDRLDDAVTEPDRDQPSDWKRILQELSSAGYKDISQLPLGSILCVVDVVDCIPTPIIVPRYYNGPPLITAKEKAFGDYSQGRYGIVTKNVRRLPKPIPVTGKQGLFDIPDFKIDF